MLYHKPALRKLLIIIRKKTPSMHLCHSREEAEVNYKPGGGRMQWGCCIHLSLILPSMISCALSTSVAASEAPPPGGGDGGSA